MQERHARRSGCPINLSLEVVGDAWSLLIVRDLAFGGVRHFNELLRSEEGISPSVLADRLRRLTDAGMISVGEDHSHKQKSIYSLTEMGIELVPVLVRLGHWGRRYLNATDELSVRIEVLERGGPAMQEQFLDELRCSHLGQALEKRSGPTVSEQLEDAYRTLVAEKANPPEAG
ncbi:winged helix-turn-helix transcriptional regulator [Amycolatopsis plumensis]|uniref:Winged helix-turn-helix transcriptional regulator n=1 Tax=Amycolatopsis plumensis TaxID=236508 RepID=A0ABV5U8M2_9PSEU